MLAPSSVWRELPKLQYTKVVEGVAVATEALNEAVLDWSAQSVLRVLSAGSVERLVDGGFLGIELRQGISHDFMKTLEPRDQQRVFQMATETMAVAGAHASTSVAARDVTGAIRYLNIRFVNASDDPRVGSLLVYIQDGTETANSESELFVQRTNANFAASFAASKTSELPQTIVEQLAKLVELTGAHGGRIGFFDSAGVLSEQTFKVGDVANTSLSLVDMGATLCELASLGEHAVVSLPAPASGNASGNASVCTSARSFKEVDVLIVPRRWPDGQVGFVGLCGPANFVSSEKVQIAFSFADLVGGSLSRLRAASDLVESEQRHRMILDRSPDHLMLIDAHHCFTYVSPSVERFFGRSSGELLGTALTDHVHPDDLEQFRYRVDETSNYSVRARSADGSWRWVEGTFQMLFDDPVIKGILVNGRDVTEVRAAQNSLLRHQRATELIATISRRFARGRIRDSEQLLVVTASELRAHVSAQEAIVWRIDETGTELVANTHLQSETKAARTLPVRLLQEVFPEVISGEVAFALASARKHLDVLDLFHTEGRTDLRSIVAIPVIAQQRLVALVTMTSDVDLDIDDSTTMALRAVCEVLASSFSKLEFEQTLRKRATTDDLTGLVNRAALHDLLEGSLAASTSSGELVSVALLDLDEFKIVNDTMGHHTGDELLRALAIRLRHSLRQEDVLARLGGDEFVVLMTTANPVSEAELRDRVDSVFATPFSLGGRAVRLSASIGVAQSSPTGVTTAEELLRQADIAMYRAKQRGPGVVQLFEADMDAGVLATMQLVEDLRVGLDDDQFEVWLQPVMEVRTPNNSVTDRSLADRQTVELRNTRLAGFEALVRWNHPRRGLVLPSDFIPVAEQYGLINELGGVVLLKAMTALRALLDANEVPETAFVAINVSTAQLVAPGFGESVLSMMLQARLSPSQIHLELTESILAQQAHWDRLAWLRALGFKLAIDDFGTGYSSLSYARDMPADSLKVDRSFVAGVATDRRDHALAAAVVSMGHALGMTVIAEGVETDEQLQALSRLGCTQFQGYFFARPMPLAAFRDWNNAHLVGSLLSL
jgi:diguanylate cyclase (GGDEF)-like protein/PAS domain S-box-containing protein